MKKIFSSLLLLALFLGLVPSPSGWADEGSFSEGSYAGPAIDGNCPVCVSKGKIMRGNDSFVTKYKGKLYYFIGYEQQKMFLNNPETYVANLETQYRSLKERSEGSPRHEGSH